MVSPTSGYFSEDLEGLMMNSREMETAVRLRLIPALEAALQGSGVHLVLVPVDYVENTRVLVDELRAKLWATSSAVELA